MQKSFLRETAGVVMRATVVILSIVVFIISVSALYTVENSISENGCNVAVLPVEGTILPFHGLAGFDLVVTPEGIETFMSSVEEDKNIKAVLVEINSPGGTPVASERIAERFKKSPLPIVGLAGDIAASGGYMIAASTDYLLASPMSTLGSIGVNMSYVEESLKNEEEGLTYVQLIAGKYKDMGSPNRPITEEERDLLQADLDIVHKEFINIVADYRDLEFSEVEKLADGTTMPGVRAIDAGLIDALGSRDEAQGVISGILDIPVEEVIFCEYDRGFLPF